MLAGITVTETALSFGGVQVRQRNCPKAHSRRHTESSAVSTNGIKGWSTNAPKRTKFGGIAATVTNINAESNADFSDNVPNSVIELPAGEHSFFGVFYGNQTPDTDLHLRLEEIRTDTDDIIRIAGTTRQSHFIGTGINDVHAVYEISRPHFVIDSPMKFYLRLVGFGANQEQAGRLSTD